MDAEADEPPTQYRISIAVVVVVVAFAASLLAPAVSAGECDGGGTQDEEGRCEGSVPNDPGDIAPGVPGPDEIRLCKDPRGAATIPITGIEIGNGGAENHYQLFAEPNPWINPNHPPPGDGDVILDRYTLYVKYNMVTHNIDNGADGWVFGIEVIGQGDRTADKVWSRQGMGCARIGTLQSRCRADPCFNYRVHGGGVGVHGHLVLRDQFPLGERGGCGGFVG